MIDRSPARERADPAAEGRRFAQLRQLRERVEEDILDEIVDVRARQPREEHGVYGASEPQVQLAVRLTIAALRRPHERDVVALGPDPGTRHQG